MFEINVSYFIDQYCNIQSQNVDDTPLHVHFINVQHIISAIKYKNTSIKFRYFSQTYLLYRLYNLFRMCTWPFKNSVFCESYKRILDVNNGVIPVEVRHLSYVYLVSGCSALSTYKAWRLTSTGAPSDPGMLTIQGARDFWPGPGCCTDDFWSYELLGCRVADWP